MSDAKEQSERVRAYEHLQEILKPGDVVYTVLRHVSRSGMMRSISPLIVKNGEIYDLTYWASQVLGWKIHKNHYGIKIGGCGMNMGFHVVYSLSSTLYPDGFGEPCRAEGCTYRPATKEEAEHCNDGLDEGVTPHEFYGRNGDRSGWDNDGGYALKQKWI